MELQEFVDDLSVTSFHELVNACNKRLERDKAADELRQRALTFAEEKLVALGDAVDAIKSVKDRLGVGLQDAKRLVELMMDDLKQRSKEKP